MSDESTTEGEDAPPPPPPVVTDASIWNPGGDAGALRAAADAWTTMATELRTRAGDVRASRTTLGGGWTGEARAAYDVHVDEVLTSMDEGADGFDEIATELRGVADQVEDINRQIHEIYLAIAATAAVSVAASFVTFGFSAAAGAANAARLTAQATSLVRTLATVVSGVRVTFHGFRFSRVLAVWKTFTVNAAGAGIATAVGKAAFQQQNPFDLDNWTIADLRNIVVAGGGGVVLGGPLTIFERGLRTRIATGAVATATPTVVTDFRDGLTPGEVVRNGAVNLLFGGAGGALGHGLRNRNVANGNGNGNGARPPIRVGDTGLDLDLPRLEAPPAPAAPSAPSAPSAPPRGPGGAVLLDGPTVPVRPPGGGVLLDGPTAPVRPPGGGVLLDGPTVPVRPPGGGVLLDGPTAPVRPPGGAVLLDGPTVPVRPPGGGVLLDGPAGPVRPPGGAVLLDPPSATAPGVGSTPDTAPPVAPPVEVAPGPRELDPFTIEFPGRPGLSLDQDLAVATTQGGGTAVNNALAGAGPVAGPELHPPFAGGGVDDAWWHELEPDPGTGGRPQLVR